MRELNTGYKMDAKTGHDLKSLLKNRYKDGFTKHTKEYTRVSTAKPWKLVSTNKGTVSNSDLIEHLIDLDFKKHDRYSVTSNRADDGSLTSRALTPNRQLKVETSYTPIGPKKVIE